MSCFLESEKPRQAAFKREFPGFSAGARADGVFRGVVRPFCLPQEFAEENLLPEIRDAALAHFARHAIKWHQGQDGKPSNHLCSSQVCCVNFLFPFADKPQLLAELLRPLFPQIKRMLPIEDGLYVTFEWIGERNYLGELGPRSGKRARGALFTSADAAVRFEDAAGAVQVVLIEWKYTESYSDRPLAIAESGTDRREIYRHAFDGPGCPIDKALLPHYDALFYEPFYQLMRQQLLAQAMEEAHELGARRVSVLHIAPSANGCFGRVTSPSLRGLGRSVMEVWGKLLGSSGRFVSVGTEDLFGPLWGVGAEELEGWLGYIGGRYGWVREGG